MIQGNKQIKIKKILTIFLVVFLFSSLPYSFEKNIINEVFAVNYLTNPSFTGGTTGWTLTSASYDSSYYQDSAGSLNNSATGRNTTSDGDATQTISTTINSTDTVYLSFYWSKQCQSIACTYNDAHVEITLPSAPSNWIVIWEDFSIPAVGSPTAWASVSNLDVSSYFTETGSYQIRFFSDVRCGNNRTAVASAWFDNISLDIQAITTLSSGTDPTNQSIAPGASVVDLNNFAFTTSAGSDSISALTLTMSPTTAYEAIGQLDISNTSNTSVCNAVSNPTSNIVNFSGCTISASTSGNEYKVRLTPKSHANMPVPNGASYSITGYISDFTTSNIKAGSDTANTTITVDNLSPAAATNTSGTASNAAVDLNWTTSTGETSNSVILRWTSSTAGTEVPAEGTTYSPGNTIGAATVACVVSGSAASTALSKTDGSGASAECTSTALTNGTDYSYKVFQQDSNGNYDTGTLFTGSPFTPQNITVSVILDVNSFDYGIIPDNTSSSTLTLFSGAGITATNNGNVTENFTIYGADTTDWTLSTTNGVDIYTHEFCNDTDNDCSNPPTNYSLLTSTPQSLKTGIPASSAVSFQLRITTPTDTSIYTPQSAVVTIQASQQ